MCERIPKGLVVIDKATMMYSSRRADTLRREKVAKNLVTKFEWQSQEVARHIRLAFVIGTKLE
jgi:hypothetical protein